MRRTTSAETAFAAGWGLNTTALPAETVAIVLLMTVAVGLVVGVIAAITPKGAHSVTVIPLSPVVACGFRSSGPGVFSVTSRFLTVLSSERPSPVSRCAISASSAADPRIAARTDSISSRRRSSPIWEKSRKASHAASAAESTLPCTPSPSALAGGSAMS
jgi:hypothetical protein